MSDQRIEKLLRAELDMLHPSGGFADVVEHRVHTVERRRQGIRATATVAAVLLVVGGVATLAGPSSDRDGGIAAETVNTPLEWEALAPSPLSSRTEPLVVATDDNLFVWGGHGPAGLRLDVQSDGALYDLDSGAWTVAADSPLGPRAGVEGVAAGGEILVWGGVAPETAVATPGTVVAGPDGEAPGFRDGAAYNFSDDSWRPIPEAPITGRLDAASIWTGTEFVILGGHDTTDTGSRHVGAAYNPSDDTWRLLPDLGYTSSTAAGAGSLSDGTIVYWRLSDPSISEPSSVDVHLYSPTADEWSTLPSLSTANAQAAVAGNQIVAVVPNTSERQGYDALVLDLTEPGATWTTTASIEDLDTIGFDVQWNGNEVLVIDVLTGSTIAVDLVTGSTATLDPPDVTRYAVSIAKGGQLFLLGDGLLLRLARA